MEHRGFQAINRMTITLSTLIALILSPLGSAADGDTDLSFGDNGRVITEIDGFVETQALAAVVLPDGRIVAAAEEGLIDRSLGLVAYHPDGSLDLSFGTDGAAFPEMPSGDQNLGGLGLTPDGKIVIVGATDVDDADRQIFIAQFTQAGALDTSFGNNGFVMRDIDISGDFASAVAPHPDGSILVLSQFTPDENNPGDRDFALTKYWANGEPDLSFGEGGLVTTDFDGFEDFPTSVLAQPDGRIIVAGAAGKQPDLLTRSDFGMARYLADGSLDASFGDGGKVRTPIGSVSQIDSVKLTQNGSIVAGWTCLSFVDTSKPQKEALS